MYLNIPDWTGAVFYYNTEYNNIPDWTGTVIYHNTEYNNIPDWTTAVRVPYFTIIMQNNNIPNRTGAVFCSITAPYHHCLPEGWRILP